jgi:hypothetical protein
MARTVERDAGLIDVNTIERGREPVRIAFAADLAVGNDVESRVLLRLDREHRRVVLRLGEERFGDAPKLLRPDARRKAASELGAINQPIRLRVRSDQRRRQKHGLPPLSDFSRRLPSCPSSSLPDKASGAHVRQQRRPGCDAGRANCSANRVSV